MANSEYSFFENKTNVVEEEIHSFLEINAAFNSLEALVNSNLQNQKDLRKEFDEVQANPKESYGIIKKVSKEARLNDLNQKLTKCDYDCSVSSELFAIVAKYVISVEIPNFKIEHHKKWNFILRTFTEEKARKMKNETQFWEKLNLFSLSG